MPGLSASRGLPCKHHQLRQTLGLVSPRLSVGTVPALHVPSMMVSIRISQLLLFCS